MKKIVLISAAIFVVISLCVGGFIVKKWNDLSVKDVSNTILTQAIKQKFIDYQDGTYQYATRGKEYLVFKQKGAQEKSFNFSNAGKTLNLSFDFSPDEGKDLLAIYEINQNAIRYDTINVSINGKSKVFDKCITEN